MTETINLAREAGLKLKRPARNAHHISWEDVNFYPNTGVIHPTGVSISLKHRTPEEFIAYIATTRRRRLQQARSAHWP